MGKYAEFVDFFAEMKWSQACAGQGKSRQESGLYLRIHEHFKTTLNAVPRRKRQFQSVELRVAFVEDQILHPSIRQLLTGLAEQNHQDNPLYLFYVDIRGFQRK